MFKKEVTISKFNLFYVVQNRLSFNIWKICVDLLQMSQTGIIDFGIFKYFSLELILLAFWRKFNTVELAIFFFLFNNNIKFYLLNCVFKT